MKITRFTLLLAASTTVLFSCGKDDDTQPEGAIQGTYEFVGMTATGTSTVTTKGVSPVEKTVTYTGYHTGDNAGTIVIDGGKMTSTAMTYTVDTVIKAEYYLDGVKEETFEVPFTFTAPPLGSTAPYKLVGTDSIYFEQGFISAPDNSGIPTTTNASGAKISWSGDTLLLRTAFAFTSTISQAGVDMDKTDVGVQIVKLKKK